MVSAVAGAPLHVDSSVNGRAGSRTYLDYVLVSNRYRQPVIELPYREADARSPTLLGNDYDLSDHFPVFGHFIFPSSAPAIAKKLSNQVSDIAWMFMCYAEAVE